MIDHYASLRQLPQLQIYFSGVSLTIYNFNTILDFLLFISLSHTIVTVITLILWVCSWKCILTLENIENTFSWLSQKKLKQNDSRSLLSWSKMTLEVYLETNFQFLSTVNSWRFQVMCHVHETYNENFQWKSWLPCFKMFQISPL